MDTDPLESTKMTAESEGVRSECGEDGRVREEGFKHLSSGLHRMSSWEQDRDQYTHSAQSASSDHVHKHTLLLQIAQYIFMAFWNWAGQVT